jgi:hypothetical protein
MLGPCVPRVWPRCGSAVSVALVTAAVFGLRAAVPVLSLGVLYPFAVLPAALPGDGRGESLSRSQACWLSLVFLPPRHTFQLADRANWLALAAAEGFARELRIALFDEAVPMFLWFAEGLQHEGPSSTA